MSYSQIRISRLLLSSWFLLYVSLGHCFAIVAVAGRFLPSGRLLHGLLMRRPRILVLDAPVRFHGIASPSIGEDVKQLHIGIHGTECTGVPPEP